MPASITTYNITKRDTHWTQHKTTLIVDNILKFFYSSSLWQRLLSLFVALPGDFVIVFLNLYGPQHDKTNKMTVRPAETQISLGIRPVWSESSLCAQWVAKYPSFLHAGSESSDQTGRLPRLIWVFAGHTYHLLVLSRGGSITSSD